MFPVHGPVGPPATRRPPGGEYLGYCRGVEEEALAGGNASGVVVRIGDTVRKPWTEATGSVIAFVTALRDQGIDAPAPLGQDVQGRQILEFVPGTLAIQAAPLTHAELRRVGRMIRDIHDASARYPAPADAVWTTAIPAPHADLVCHNDLAPWNLLLGERWVFIDWDAAAPSTRLWDLAYAAQAFTLSHVEREPALAAADLAALIAGYDADPELRAALPLAMLQRTEAMLNLLATSHARGFEPWASMYADGHGAHWASAVRYVAENQALWARALAL